MATNYPGNPAATEPPSVPPAPGAVPTVKLPDDDDDLNADSVRQALMVLADFIAWIMLLFLQSMSSGTTSPSISRWKDYLGNVRFCVDHNGFPAGDIYRRLEYFDWAGTTFAATQTPITLHPSLSFACNGTGAGNVGAIQGGFAGTYFHIASGTTAGSYGMILTSIPFVNVTEDATIAAKFSAIVSDAITAGTVTIGFTSTGAFASGSYCAIKAIGNGHWHFICNDGVGGDTDVDLGISPNNSEQFFQLEIQPADSIYAAGNAGNPVARVSINGGTFTTITTNVPADDTALAFSGRDEHIAAGNSALYLGQWDISFNRFQNGQV